MILGIFARTFESPIPLACLQAAADAGYSCVQFNMMCAGLRSMPDSIAARSVRQIAAAARQADVKIVAVSGTYNMIHPDAAVRAQGLFRLRVMASECAALGANLITLCTGSRDPDDQWRYHKDNDSPGSWRSLMSEMEQAVDIADEFGVELGIEPELANVVNTAASAKRLIDEIGSKRLKIVLDPANLFEVASLGEQRAIVSRSIDILAERITLAHAKDRRPDGAFTAAGKGVLDYPHFLSALKSIGFEGPLVAHGLAAEEAPGVAEFLAEILSASET